MNTLSLPISEFTAHPSQELMLVETIGATIELTRDGKVIARISPADPVADSGTVADWIGSGAGFALSPGSRIEDPAWDPDEWENWIDSRTERRNAR